jgi:hypothetical protein
MVFDTWFCIFNFGEIKMKAMYHDFLSMERGIICQPKEKPFL